MSSRQPAGVRVEPSAALRYGGGEEEPSAAPPYGGGVGEDGGEAKRVPPSLVSC